MVVPSVRVQSRVPSFEEKSLVVIDFKTNNLDVFKVHVVAGMVDMACNFGHMAVLQSHGCCSRWVVSLTLSRSLE